MSSNNIIERGPDRTDLIHLINFGPDGQSPEDNNKPIDGSLPIDLTDDGVVEWPEATTTKLIRSLVTTATKNVNRSMTPVEKV